MERPTPQPNRPLGAAKDSGDTDGTSTLVARAMIIRLRAMYAVFAVTALFSLAIAAVASHGDGEVPSAELSALAAPATMAARPTLTEPSARMTPVRAAVAYFVDISNVVAGGAGLMLARLTHEPRLLGDVGDDWRALLLGAPPATA